MSVSGCFKLVAIGLASVAAIDTMGDPDRTDESVRITAHPQKGRPENILA